MTSKIKVIIVYFLLAVSISVADTFTHRQTGESFDGFATQKILGTRTRVYNAIEKTFKPIDLAEYNVKRNALGRRDNIVIIQINLI